ncbi:MAG: ECF-type sigma factor, partial [Acidobacteriota bacterium]
LLDAWSGGDSGALDRLMPLVFEDLRIIARRYFAGEDPSHTLQPTALVNEFFVYLNGCRSVQWKNPKHFFATAAKKIRLLLVDHARHRYAQRRGGDMTRVPLEDELMLPARLSAEELITVDEALRELQARDPRQCQVVELRYFGGLTIEETGKVLGVQSTTVKKDWRIARAWLQGKLQSKS